MHEETAHVIELMRAAGSRIRHLGRPSGWRELDDDHDEQVRSLRVLLVEDCAPDAELFCRALRSLDPEIVVVETLGHARRELMPSVDAGRRRVVDVVVIDLELPDSSPENTLVFAHDLARRLPVIIISGRDDIESEDESLLGFLHKRADNSGWLVEKLCELMQRHGARALERATG